MPNNALAPDAKGRAGEARSFGSLKRKRTGSKKLPVDDGSKAGGVEGEKPALVSERNQSLTRFRAESSANKSLKPTSKGRGVKRVLKNQVKLPRPLEAA